MLSESIAIFHENFFPSEKRSEIPAKILKILNDPKKNKKLQSETNSQTTQTNSSLNIIQSSDTNAQSNQQLQQQASTKKRLSSEKKKEREKIQMSLAFEIFKSLKSVIEFLDYSNRGLLTGDLSTETITIADRALKRALELLKTKELEANNLSRDKIIYTCYSEIIKTAMEGLFRLPKNGIKYPEFENPRNLFERQLLLEDESNDIAIEKFLSVYEDLQNIGLSFNLQFARKYIVEWFPNLTKAIKEEQEACMVGDLKGEFILINFLYRSIYKNGMEKNKLQTIIK